MTWPAAISSVRWRDLVALSHPGAWAVTGLPFYLAALDVDRGITLPVILGTIYFLAPYGLLAHGLADLFAATTDPRTVLDRAEDRGTLLAIAAVNLPILLILAVIGGAAAALALVLAVGVALAGAVPPLRTRERPVLDLVTRAVEVTLAAICGSLVAGASAGALPWTPFLVLFLWAAGSFGLRAIRDVEADRTRNVTSSATAFGTTPVAVFALIAFALATLVAVVDGVSGLLSGVGLALFVIPPIAVLTGADAPSAARRAWSWFVGLDVVVGAWLVFLLLRHWTVIRFSAWELALAMATAATGLVLANIAATRLATRRRPIPLGGPATAIPSVTVVIACRDDAPDMPAALAAIRDQTYADATILVVDDGSTDGSASLARSIVREGSEVNELGRVIVPPPVPEGWTSRNWACWTGAQEATTDLVLFIDADTVLAPIALRVLVEQLLAGGYDLASGVTRPWMPTHTERAAMASFPLSMFGTVPIWWSALTDGRPARAAFAFGPLMLVRRDAYLAVGGHGAHPASLRAGIDLARAFVRDGRRVGTIHVADLGTIRRYRTVGEVIGGWRRRMVAHARPSPAAAIVFLLVEVVAFVLPIALPIVAVATRAPPTTTAATLIPFGLLVLGRLLLAVTQRHPIETVLWHPVTVAIATVGQLAGIADLVLGGRVGRRDAARAAPPIDAAAETRD